MSAQTYFYKYFDIEMPGLIRSIPARLREVVANRRCALRQKIECEARLFISASRLDQRLKNGLAEPTLTVKAHTRDISANGLALFVTPPRRDIQNLELVGRILRIALELPRKAVNLRAIPVRCDPPEDDDLEARHVLGVKIIEMRMEDRDSLIRYLQRLRYPARDIAPLFIFAALIICKSYF